MPIEFYQGLSFFILGCIFGFVVLTILGISKHRLLIILAAGAFGVLVEWTIWPMNNAYDPRRILVSALGGGLGGLIGAGIGALFDKMRDGKGLSLAAPLAVVGFLAGNLSDAGGSIFGNGLFDTILPETAQPGPSSLTAAEFRAEILSDNDPMGAGIREAHARNPQAMNAYIDWLHETTSRAWDDGLRGAALEQNIQAQSGILADQMLLRLSPEGVSQILDIRTALNAGMHASDPRLCIGSAASLGMQMDPGVLQRISSQGIEVLSIAFETDTGTEQPLLREDQFNSMTDEIFASLFATHGDDVLVFIGQVPAGPENADQYCRVEVDFLSKISQLEGGPFGMKEEYYRTLTATILQSAP